MPAAPAAPTPALPIGTAVGLAQRALSAVLHSLLTEQEVPPATWYTLNAMALRGPRVQVATLAGLLSFNGLDAHEVEQLLDELSSRDQVQRDGSEVVLTDTGRAEFQRIRTAVSALTAQLVQDVHPDELTVTTRVLQALTERAEATAGI
jgi:DNA-binding MarR family transcriptional regulator